MDGLRSENELVSNQNCENRKVAEKVDILVSRPCFAEFEQIKLDDRVIEDEHARKPADNLPSVKVHWVPFGVRFNQRHESFSKHALALDNQELLQKCRKVVGVETVPQG